ncbi:MAG: hypothetical protein R3325_08050 [Thermoanaerobaculia bacterium]|nr:hypothetical protein [Thermoanaerobaculia bacterium]
MQERPSYEELEVSELFCPRCRQARPVRQRLLIVLPQGSKYDYQCRVCGESLGTKTDDDPTAFSVLLPR